MFYLTKPGRDSILAFIASQKDRPFSYRDVGASRREAPSGFTVDHNRVRLGEGAEVFERAKNAIRQWKMFQMRWIDLCWPDVSIEPGATVAVLISHFGFWSLNACRIVFVLDEHGLTERYGFAYGTLEDHGEIGEERFAVELDSSGSVWYDLYAFSRPGLAARLAYPLSRLLQKRFAKASKEAMLRSVQGSKGSQAQTGSHTYRLKT
jgi:uncharacterized protein (UPF0548 family)